MPEQPKKHTINYEKYFSNEIKSLIEDTVTYFAKELLPSTSITPELFFIGALGDADCLLYKVLNGYLTTVKIQEIHDKLFLQYKDEHALTVVKPTRILEYSQELRSLFQRANVERQKHSYELITSDLVLLAVMNEKVAAFDQIFNVFADESITYDIVENLSKKMHDAVELVADENVSLSDTLSNLINGLDLADGNSVQSITIYGNMDDNSSPEQIIEELKDAFSNVSVSSAVKKDKKPGQKKDKSAISFCTCLNDKAELGEIDTLVGREDEIKSIVKIFGRRKRNNVVLVGENGVGKTQIVEGLAKKIVDGVAPQSIANCKIYKLNALDVTAGTQFRGMFEDRLSTLSKELVGRKNAILFIDDVHNLTSDSTKNEYDFFGFLSGIFDNPDVKVIVTVTQKGYHTSFESNNDIKSKFQRISVDPPTDEQCLNILQNAKKYYEEYHGVTYSDEAIHACVSLSKRYITDRNLPSSAIDIMDEAGSMKKIKNSENEKIVELKNELLNFKNEKDKKIKNNEETDEIDEKIGSVKLDISLEMDNISENKVDNVITEEDIYVAVSEYTNIPIQKINSSEKKLLSKIDGILKKDIIGQDEAIDVVARAIKRNKAGLGSQNRPILSCMCIGSTGTGKTLLAKKLAQEIFGSEKYLVRFDMSEYADKTSVNKLIGASAGYVGYNEGGLLTEAVKNKKHAVVLIDELEKANDEVFNLFLQILDDGYLTDNTGRKVDFRNTILIMTSNIGAKRAENDKEIGFRTTNGSKKRSIIEKELKNKFQPEFLNRIDEIVYFNTLSDENLKKIVRLEIDKLGKRLKELKFEIEYDDAVVDYILKCVEKEKDFGARPILRAVRTNIEDKITDLIIDNDFTEHTFKVTVNEENNIKIE